MSSHFKKKFIRNSFVLLLSLTSFNVKGMEVPTEGNSILPTKSSPDFESLKNMDDETLKNALVPLNQREIVDLWKTVILDGNPSDKTRFFNHYLEFFSTRLFHSNNPHYNTLTIADAIEGPFCQVKANDSIKSHELTALGSNGHITALDL